MNTAHDPGHGSSPAAWTAVIIMLVGISAGALFFWLDQPTLVMASAVVVAAGPFVGWLIAKAGYGVKGPKYQAKH
ncbi:MAG: DUF6704 family protein [Microbacteriaceae bacterium]